MSTCDSSSYSSNVVTDSSNSSNTSLTTGFISIPYTDSSLEDFSEQRKPEKLRQCYRGQLRIDVNVTGNYIFTHIIAARNLGAKLKSKPSSFVEISIIPESRVHSKCMSTIYRSSHRPVFDEKVSMELPINFQSKRLLVTVYHDRQFNKNHEILGCMSFGLHRISTGSPFQLACGWFYLLDEDIGKRRHVKVINNAINVKSYSASMNISKLLLCRTPDGGFGFSVIGSGPVRICRVKKGSTAEMHNLQQDDTIIMIDSRDVSRCTSMEVSSIIRSTKHFMTVAIQRGPHYTCDKNEDKVKNGMVAKLIKKIFFSSNHQRKTSVTTTTTTSSDVLVDYGWLENDRQHSRERPTVPLDGTRDFQNVFQQRAQKDSNSRGWPHSTSNGKENIAIDHRGIRLARQDGIESDPGTPDQRWHSKKEIKGRYDDDDDDDDDSDGSDYDDLQSSNLGRMSKMLSPVAECDSQLQADSQFLGSDDDTYEGDSQNNANVGAAAAINSDEFLRDDSVQSIYDANNKNDNRSLMSDSRLMTDDYDENGYLDDNDSNYDEGNLDPKELNRRGSCQLYLDENQDLDQKENLFRNGLLPTTSRRTGYTSHRRLSFRRNHPLTSRENFSPNFQETPDSLRNRHVNNDSDAFSSILDTPSAPQKNRKGKAVVSKIKTIFKNRHAS